MLLLSFFLTMHMLAIFTVAAAFRDETLASLYSWWCTIGIHVNSDLYSRIMLLGSIFMPYWNLEIIYSIFITLHE